MLRSHLSTNDQSRFGQIVEGLPQCIFEADPNGIIVYANEYALHKYGYTRADIATGLELSNFIHTDTLELAHQNISRILNGEPIMGQEYIGLHKDGSTFPIKVYSNRIVVDGKPVGLRGVIIDISDIRDVQHKLEKSEAYYRTLFENTGTATTILRNDSVIESCNSQFAKLAGYSVEEIQGKMRWTDFVDPKDLEAMVRYHNERVETGKKPPTNYEFTFITKDGSRKAIHVFVRVIPGTTLRVSSLIDITERKQALQALKDSEERYALVARGANDGMWDWNVINDTVYYSPRYKEMLGYTDEEFPNHADSWLNAIHPDDKQKTIDGNLECKEGRADKFAVEYRMFHKDGSIVWILGRGASAKNEKGEVVRMAGTHTDVTQRKQAEEALRKSEERFRSIFEQASSGIYQSTPRGKMLQANTAMARIFGFDSSKQMLEDITDIGSKLWANPSERPAFLRLLDKKDKLYNYEFRGKRKDGTEVWVSENIRTVRNKDGEIEYYEGFLQDITARKINERIAQAMFAISTAVSTTRDMNELYETIHAIIAGVIHAKNFFIATIDFKHDRLGFAYFKDECDDYYTIDNLSDPKHSSLTIHILRTGTPLLLSKNDPDYESTLHEIKVIGTYPAVWLGVPLKLGDEIVGAMAVQDYQDPTQYSENDVTFLTAVSEQVAMAIERKKNEEALTTLNEELEMKVDERTTELKNKAAELEEANKRLLELDEIKSSLVSSVSHELRTPLTSIRGFAKLCARDFTRHFQPLAATPKLVQKGERIHDNLGIIDTEGERLTRLINDFLDINRIESGKASWHDHHINPCEVIAQATQAASGGFAASTDVNLVVDLPDAVPYILADPDKLKQVLINLLNNAYKFTKQGTVTVSLNTTQDAIQVSIADTGPGIPAEELPAIFDKFHKIKQGDTVDSKEKGTGLGLAICKEIVEHYGGTIHAESTEGVGSKFTFSIPTTTDRSNTCR